MRYGLPAAMLAGALAFAPALADEGNLPPVAYPKIVAHAATHDGFVPAGWRLEQSRTGDLNGDGLSDVVIVLRDNDPKNVIANSNAEGGKLDTNPRILMIAFANAAGGYDLVLENHNFVPRTDNATSQDPLDPKGTQAGSIAIGHGTLHVNLGYFQSAGGWDMGMIEYIFRYQHGAFALIGYDNIDVHRDTGDIVETSANYSTGRVKIGKSRTDDQNAKVTWANLAVTGPVTMDQIGDGMAYQPPIK